MQSLESQFYAFAVTVVMGLTVGVLYDLYRVTKGIIRPGKVAAYLGDILFWILSTLLVFFMLLIGNWGEVRLYVALGVVLGVAVYIRLISRWVILALQRIIYLVKVIIINIKKAAGYVWFVVTYPFIVAKNIIVIPIGYLGMIYTGITGVAGRLGRRIFIRPVVNAAAITKAGIKKHIASLLRKR